MKFFTNNTKFWCKITVKEMIKFIIAVILNINDILTSILRALGKLVITNKHFNSHRIKFVRKVTIVK